MTMYMVAVVILGGHLMASNGEDFYIVSQVFFPMPSIGGICSIFHFVLRLQPP